MKAYLLAGGRGERLRPLTDRLPKCLAPIDGRPLLDFWLDLCARDGVTEVLLNVSHHFALIDDFLAQRPSRAPRVHVIHEHEPSGTATTVRRARDFVAGEDSFLVIYADNLTDMSLRPMLALHRSHAEPLTMGLFRTPSPRQAGIVDLAADGRVTGFVEKPLDPESDLANAGLYVARRSVFDWIPAGPDPVDFGQHVLPALVGRMFGYEIPELYADIGTAERLHAATAAWIARPGHSPRPSDDADERKTA